MWGRGDRSRFSVYNPAEEDVTDVTATTRMYSRGRSERCIVGWSSGRGGLVRCVHGCKDCRSQSRLGGKSPGNQEATRNQAKEKDGAWMIVGRSILPEDFQQSEERIFFTGKIMTRESKWSVFRETVMSSHSSTMPTSSPSLQVSRCGHQAGLTSFTGDNTYILALRETESLPKVSPERHDIGIDHEKVKRDLSIAGGLTLKTIVDKIALVERILDGAGLEAVVLGTFGAGIRLVGCHA